jgi:hypothetical protein
VTNGQTDVPAFDSLPEDCSRGSICGEDRSSGDEERWLLESIDKGACGRRRNGHLRFCNGMQGLWHVRQAISPLVLGTRGLAFREGERGIERLLDLTL